MGFDIKFDKIQDDIGYGKIVLDDYSENFESPLHFWTILDYKNQWEEGIIRIKYGNHKSALVTAMYPPQYANYIIWWVIYKEYNYAVFQNHILFLEKLNKPFVIDNIYSYIPEKSNKICDEYAVSEWRVLIDTI